VGGLTRKILLPSCIVVLRAYILYNRGHARCSEDSRTPVIWRVCTTYDRLAAKVLSIQRTPNALYKIERKYHRAQGVVLGPPLTKSKL
jgi:hypothetical protein